MQITEYRQDNQNSTGTGTYGDASLTSGFQPDPHRMSGTAGGTVNASSFGGNGCVGTIANNPDHVVTLNSSFSYLRFLITSSEDTTLVIRGPNGQVYCDDDSVGLNPQIGRDFSSGRYEIYIGVYDEGYPSYDLEITEYRP
jgi:hypothetical protein